MLVTSSKALEMTVEERRRRRFSEPFRKEQVALIEGGKITVAEVSRLYEVKQSSVREWLKKYGTIELAPPILIQSSKEIDRLRELEKENRNLKQIIGTQQVRLIYMEELVKMAKERLGPGFEKK